MSQQHPLGLRLIAVFKIFKGLLFLGVSWELFQLIHEDLGRIADAVLTMLRANTENRIVHSLQEHFIALSPQTLHHAGVGALLYSFVLLVEGLGLWQEKRWAEYLVIINSGLFVPFELEALFRHRDIFHVIVIVINLLILGYVTAIVLGKGNGRTAEKDTE